MEQNNNEKNMPVGFAFSLAMNQDAMAYYSSLNENTKNDIKNYIQNSQSGYDAKIRIDAAVQNLANQNINFLK